MRPKDDDASKGNSEEPEFRSPAHNGVRYPLRLEPVFWRILELAARTARKRMPHYLADLISAQQEGANRASIVRAHAAEWLSDRVLEATRSGVSLRSLRGVGNAMPLPTFSISSANVIISSNAAFSMLARRLVDQAGGGASRLTIAFTRDFEALRTSIVQAADGCVEEQLVLRCGEARLMRVARIACLDAPSGGFQGFFVVIVGEAGAVEAVP